MLLSEIIRWITDALVGNHSVEITELSKDRVPFGSQNRKPNPAVLRARWILAFLGVHHCANNFHSGADSLVKSYFVIRYAVIRRALPPLHQDCRNGFEPFSSALSELGLHEFIGFVKLGS